MKTTIQGLEPNTTNAVDVTLETVYAPTVAGETLIDVRVGDKVARVNLRELSAAVFGAEKAVPPPGWSPQGLYGPNGTSIPPAVPWGVRQW